MQATAGLADNDGVHHGKVLPTLSVSYTWEEQRAMDAALAVNGIFLFAMVLSAAVAVYILTLGDRTSEYLAAMYVAVFDAVAGAG